MVLSAIGSRLGQDKYKNIKSIETRFLTNYFFFYYRILLIEANDQIFSDIQAAKNYQLVTTRLLYKMTNTFSGIELRDAVQQTIDAFNRSQVNGKYLLRLPACKY